MSGVEVEPVPRDFAAGGAALAEFALGLTASSSLQELERAFVPRFGRLMTAPMYGFYALDPEEAQIEHNVAGNVSDVFVVRYVRAMEHDMLLARSRETGRAVYNLGMMPEPEWEESRVYRDAYSTHKMRHVVEVPIVAGDEIVGPSTVRPASATATSPTRTCVSPRRLPACWHCRSSPFGAGSSATKPSKRRLPRWS